MFADRLQLGSTISVTPNREDHFPHTVIYPYTFKGEELRSVVPTGPKNLPRYIVACVELKVCKHLHQSKPLFSHCISENSHAADVQTHTMHLQSEEKLHIVNTHCDQEKTKKLSHTEECLCMKNVKKR